MHPYFDCQRIVVVLRIVYFPGLTNRRGGRCELRSALILIGLIAGGITLASAGIGAGDAAQQGAGMWQTRWEYEGPKGPEHWAELDPDYAACNGKQQSPIDIQETVKADLPPLKFDFKSGPLKYLINNGYTVRVNYHGPENENFLSVGDARYQLTQFHFHRPSEDQIRGKVHDMVAHFVFASSDKKLAAVTVFLKAGAANSTMQQIWDYMPMTEGPEHEIPGVQLNPAGLLPNDIGYYTYMGSLTAPPCTEGVVWFVLKTPVEISAEQIAKFAELYPHDVRPIQPLNGRLVQESQ